MIKRKNLVTLTFLFSVGTFLIFPHNTKANTPGVLLQSIQRIGNAAQGAVSVSDFELRLTEQIEELNRQRERRLEQVAALAFKRALNFFLQNLAHDSAVAIVSGGEGQSALFFEQDFGGYITQQLDSAGGIFAESLLSDQFNINFSGLCNPGIPFRLSLTLGLPGFERPSPPSCTLTELAGDWRSRLGSADFADFFVDSIDPRANQLGIAGEVQRNYLGHLIATFVSDKTGYELNEGFKNLTDPVTGEILTPGSVIRETFLGSVDQSLTSLEETRTGDIVADAIDTFINTLAGELFKKIFYEGLRSPGGSRGSQLGINLRAPGSAAQLRGTQAAQERFATIFDVSRRVGGPQAILAELTTCNNVNNPAPNNCVIDQKFRQAIENEFTVQQAIDRGFLDSEAPFGFIPGSFQPQYNEGIPYRSILVLRTHRIVPVTWELAATFIDENGGQYNLGDLIGEFDNVNSPFFGLIDPNWVLKAPEAFCAVEGFSTYLNSDSISNGVRNVARVDYCADQQSCLEEDIDGTCKTYGYCTKEKPTWDFQSNRCSEDFATCLTFAGVGGNNVRESYLKNTLDFEGCNVDSVGCQWYCSEYNPVNGVWTCTEEQEKVLRECNNPNGCNATVSCFVAQGQQSCQSDEGALLFLNSPCGPTSPGWDPASTSCFRSEACTIEFGGVECIVPSCSELPNQVANGSFETPHPTPLVNNDPAASWIRLSNNLPFSLTRVTGSNEQVFTDNFSLRFFTNGGVTQPNVSQPILQNDSTTLTGLTPGTTYTASIWVYNNLQLGSVFLNVTSGAATCNTQTINPQKGSWRQLACNFDAGQNSATLQVFVTDNPVGTFWLDEATITQECLNEQATVTLIGQVDLDESKIYFDNDAQSCAASDAGCTNLLRLDKNFGRNLITSNQSFESGLAPWSYSGSGAASVDNIQANFGQASAQLQNVTTGDALTLSNQVSVSPGVPYIFSTWALGDNDGQGLTLQIDEFGQGQFKATQTQNVTAFNWQQFNLVYSPTQNFCQNGLCTADGEDCSAGGDAACELIDSVTLLLVANTDGGELHLDDVTFGDISGFSVSGPVSQAQVANAGDDFGVALDDLHLKQPPDYLGCTGDLATDPFECAAYTGVCTVDEVGCDLYSPTNGDVPIPGIPVASDFCPAECVGYDAFKQSATNYENEQFPVYLIPDAGAQCNAAAVGCQEFTNLDEVARGGEGREYYTFLRQCVKPENAVAAGDSCGTFFTWVGSDISGFQLQVHNLQLSNDPATECDPSVSICPAQVNLATDFGECDNLQDAIDNPFCKEFIAPNGDRSYIIIEQTISCTDNCVPYRATDVALGAADCQAFGGTEEDANGDGVADACIFNAVPEEGQTCSAPEAGCREYRGNAAPNVFTVFSDNFEFNAAEQWRSGTISSESTSVGGHSLMSLGGLLETQYGEPTSGVCNESDPNYNSATRTCTGFDQNNEAECQVEFGQRRCSSLANRLVDNGDYLISFWIKNSTAQSTNVSVTLHDVDATLLNLGQISVGGNWQNFLLGPFTLGTVDPETTLRLTGLSGGVDLFIDNVVLKQVQDFEYLIKDSWDIPLSCDSNPALDTRTFPQPNAPQFMLGCQEYSDRFGQAQYLKSFDQLCRASAAGCEAFIDTHNSDSPFQEQFNVGDALAEVTVPADEVVYLVNDPDYYCASSAQGCTEFGLPQVNDQTGEVESYSTSYIIKNPETLSTALCESQALGCEAWQSDEGLSYFKAPGERTCEFKAAGADPVPRWYKSGTDELCPVDSTPLGVLRPDRACVGGFSNGQQCSTDADCLGPNAGSADDGICQNWAGLCEPQSNSCTEYIDPGSNNRDNLLFNGGFEQDVSPGPGVDGWEGGGIFDNEGKFGTVGARSDLLRVDGTEGAFQFNNPNGIYQDVLLPRHTLFTLSFEAAAASPTIPSTGELRATLACLDFDGEQELASPDNSAAITNNILLAGQTYDVAELRVPASAIKQNNQLILDTGAFTRFSGRVFVDNLNTDCRVFYGESPDVPTENVFFDDVAIRETGVYYQLKNDVDYTSCNGIVDENEGCVLFNDRSAVNYSIGDSDSSYLIFNSHQTENGSAASTDCASGNCNSNAIIDVKPDRECGEWLSCSSQSKIIGADGQENDVCVDLRACRSNNALGQCDEYVIYPERPSVNQAAPYSDNQTFAYRQVDQIRNLSGYSTAGVAWKTCVGGSNAGNLCTSDAECGGGSCLERETYEGLYHYSVMPQQGELSEVPNGDFEFFFETGQPVGWQTGTATPWDANQFRVVSDYAEAVNQHGVPIRNGTSMLRIGGGHQARSEPFDIFSNSDYFVTLEVNTLNLKPKDSAVRVSVFFKVDPNNPVQTLDVPAGLDWQTYTLKLPQCTSSVTVNGVTINNCDQAPQLSVQLANNYDLDNDGACDDLDGDGLCDITGSSFFDNIRVRPVLEIQELDATPQFEVDTPAQIIPRNSYAECRAYPEDDALSCEYVDENGQFQKGWQGYCLLRDPNNPALCLQWWPVDLIKGDIFGNYPGYTDRIPLYYCVEAEVNEFDSDFTNVTSQVELPSGFNSNQFAVFEFDPYMIDQIDETTGGPWAEWSGSDGGNDKDDNNLCFWVAKDLDEDGRPIWSPPIRPVTGGLSGACTGLGNQYFFDIAQVEIQHGSSGTISQDPYWDDTNFITHWLYSTWTTSAGPLGCQGVGTDGFDDFSGNFTATLNECSKYIENSCEAFARTVTSNADNKAWLGRVSEGSSYEVPVWGYDYLADLAPFGAAVPPSPVDDPTQWSGDTEFATQLKVQLPDTQNFQPPYQARAGQPYGCIGTWDCIAAAEPRQALNTGVAPSVTQGIEFVKRLFAKSYGLWEWQTNQYVPVLGFEDVCATGTPNAGQICSVDSDCGSGAPAGSCQQRIDEWDVPTGLCPNNERPAYANDYCGVAPIVSNVLVENNQGVHNIHNAGSVSFSFNVSVNGEQLPLAGYQVDWGDGEKISVSGVDLRDRANPALPYKLSHFYSYYDVLAKNANFDDQIYCDGEIGASVPAWATGLTLPERTCAVRPQVQVIDNWGWCNADIDADTGLPSVPGLWGRHGSACQTFDDTWQPFDGIVIIFRD